MKKVSAHPALTFYFGENLIFLNGLRILSRCQNISGISQNTNTAAQ